MPKDVLKYKSFLKYIWKNLQTKKIWLNIGTSDYNTVISFYYFIFIIFHYFYRAISITI